MTCPCCEHLTEENIRKAFRERKSLILPRIDMIEKWHDTPSGRAAAAFFCDACGQTVRVEIELKDEPDPADWWKS